RCLRRHPDVARADAGEVGHGDEPAEEDEGGGEDERALEDAGGVGRQRAREPDEGERADAREEVLGLVPLRVLPLQADEEAESEGRAEAAEEGGGFHAGRGEGRASRWGW